MDAGAVEGGGGGKASERGPGGLHKLLAGAVTLSARHSRASSIALRRPPVRVCQLAALLLRACSRPKTPSARAVRLPDSVLRRSSTAARGTAAAAEGGAVKALPLWRCMLRGCSKRPRCA